MATICGCGCGQEIPFIPAHRYRQPRYIRGHAQRAPEWRANWAKSMANGPTERPAGMPVHVCQCGCGEEIPWRPSHEKRPPKYIQAHYLRIGTHGRVVKLREARQKARLAPPEGWAAPSGICECGCGRATTLAKDSRPERGEYIGYPHRFVYGHSGTLGGKASAAVRQGRKHRNRHGYILLHMPEHPKADNSGYVMEHRYVYERSRGLELDQATQVHHINGVRDDNRPENLIAVSRVDHLRAHRVAREWAALFLDDRLLEAARAYFRERRELPDLEALTRELYVPSA